MYQCRAGKLYHAASCIKRTPTAQNRRSRHSFTARKQQHFSKRALISILRACRKQLCHRCSKCKGFRRLIQKSILSDADLCADHFSGIFAARIEQKPALPEAERDCHVCPDSAAKHRPGIRFDSGGKIHRKHKGVLRVDPFDCFPVNSFCRTAQTDSKQSIYNNIIFSIRDCVTDNGAVSLCRMQLQL